MFQQTGAIFTTSNSNESKRQKTALSDAKQGDRKMARFEMNEAIIGSAGGAKQADMLLELGMMYATGRDCETDLVAAHKWFNIAAIKGSRRAAALRAELSESMSKSDIAKALREAREWMTMH